MPRRDWVGLALALGAAAVCVRLGIWQVARLHQRRARNAVVLAARQRPPVELGTVRGEGGGVVPESLLLRRVHARGVYDFERERLWRPKSFEDEPGVDLVTPLRLADGTAVLVDRGWVASPDAYHVAQPLYREPDTADVVGLALAAPRGRGDVDPVALKDSLPFPLLPFVVQQLPSPPASARPLPPGLVRWPVPELGNGPHLSYAIQWFSFAVIIVAGSISLFVKRREEALPPRVPLR